MSENFPYFLMNHNLDNVKHKNKKVFHVVMNEIERPFDKCTIKIKPYLTRL